MILYAMLGKNLELIFNQWSMHTFCSEPDREYLLGHMVSVTTTSSVITAVRKHIDDA